jgi:hypothetical protein
MTKIKRYFRFLLLAGFIVLLLAGCLGKTSVLSTPTEPVDLNLTRTSLAQQILANQLEQAASTLTARSEQAAAASTPTPVETIVPTASPTSPTSTPSPVATPINTFAVKTVQPTLIPSLTPSPNPTGIATVEGGELSLPSPTPYSPADAVLFADDFSSLSGWFVDDKQKYSMGFSDGGYQISVNGAASPIWSVPLADYKDSRIESDAVQQSGPVDGYYGLVCRYTDVNNYYMLVVSVGGKFDIAKVKNNQVNFLNSTDKENNRIHLTGNRLRADCVGSKLVLYVDGVKVLEAADDEFASGKAGLVVGDRSTSGTNVLFDNFVVIQP